MTRALCTFQWLRQTICACPAGARIAKLVRNAEKAKTPVMCVIGKKEAETGAACLGLLLAVPSENKHAFVVLCSACQSFCWPLLHLHYIGPVEELLCMC